MKKFKLNAILASVLSLGIVCSSSVCASGRLKQINSRSSEEYDDFYEKSDEEKARDEIKVLEEIFKEYELYRLSATRDINTAKESIREPYDIKKHYNIIINVEKEITETLSSRLYELMHTSFKCLYLLGRTWDDKTSEWFNEHGLEYLTKNGNTFYTMAKENFGLLSFAIKDINSNLENLPGLKYEKLLFRIFEEIANETKRYLDVFKEKTAKEIIYERI